MNSSVSIVLTLLAAASLTTSAQAGVFDDLERWSSYGWGDGYHAPSRARRGVVARRAPARARGIDVANDSLPEVAWPGQEVAPGRVVPRGEAAIETLPNLPPPVFYVPSAAPHATFRSRYRGFGPLPEVGEPVAVPNR